MTQVQISTLLFPHEEVDRKKVRKYVCAFLQGASVEPINVEQFIPGSTYLNNGTHRSIAKYLLYRKYPEHFDDFIEANVQLATEAEKPQYKNGHSSIDDVLQYVCDHPRLSRFF